MYFLKFYLVFYVLCLLHGLQRITSSPRFWMFFAGPAAIFAIDKVMLVIYIRVRETQQKTIKKHPVTLFVEKPLKGKSRQSIILHA